MDHMAQTTEQLSQEYGYALESSLVLGPIQNRYICIFFGHLAIGQSNTLRKICFFQIQGGPLGFVFLFCFYEVPYATISPLILEGILCIHHITGSLKIYCDRSPLILVKLRSLSDTQISYQ